MFYRAAAFFYTLNVLPLRRGSPLAVAWGGWFGQHLWRLVRSPSFTVLTAIASSD
jgi:hypothetical protein